LRRPEFQKLQADIAAGKIGTVVCWKIDRLSRRMVDGVTLLSHWCEAGIDIKIVTQGIDLSGTVGHMIAGLLLSLAELETSYRAERQAAGIKAAKARGVYIGREPGTYKNENGPKRALELRRKGNQDTEIARSLGVSLRTVQRYLRTAEAVA